MNEKEYPSDHDLSTQIEEASARIKAVCDVLSSAEASDCQFADTTIWRITQYVERDLEDLSAIREQWWHGKRSEQQEADAKAEEQDIEATVKRLLATLEEACPGQGKQVFESILDHMKAKGFEETIKAAREGVTA